MGIELVVMLLRMLKPHKKLSDLFDWRTITENGQEHFLGLGLPEKRK